MKLFKKSLMITALLSGGLSLGALSAPPAPSASSASASSASSASAVGSTQRYGVIDLRGIVTTVNDGIKAQQELQEEATKIQSEIEKKQRELLEKQEKFTKKAPLMKESVKQQQYQQLHQEAMALEQEKVEVQKSFMGKEQEAFRVISEKASKLVGLVAEEENLTLVFDKTSGVVWVKPELLIDLTPKVIEMYNNMTKKPKLAAKSKDKKSTSK